MGIIITFEIVYRSIIFILIEHIEHNFPPRTLGKAFLVCQNPQLPQVVKALAKGIEWQSFRRNVSSRKGRQKIAKSV